MTPERITDEEREVIHQEFKEGRLPGWMFKRILDSERHAWAALEETQHLLHDQDEALIAANGLIEDLQIQLLQAQQTIARKQLYIEKLQLSRESAQKAADNISKEKGLELFEARQTIARQREASLERLLLEMWDAAGIEEIYKYKNRIKVFKRPGLVSYELFCDFTYRMFQEVYDTANDNHTTAEDAKVSVKALLAALGEAKEGAKTDV